MRDRVWRNLTQSYVRPLPQRLGVTPRGNRRLPPDSEMEQYPPGYCLYFYYVEKHALTVAHAKHDPTDQEMEEIYSMFRRRPDGRSLGDVHDFLWQVAALMLGQYALSGPEFEAIFGQLERSARKWGLRPISRNYIEYLRNTLDGDPFKK